MYYIVCSMYMYIDDLTIRRDVSIFQYSVINSIDICTNMCVCVCVELWTHTFNANKFQVVLLISFTEVDIMYFNTAKGIIYLSITVKSI